MIKKVASFLIAACMFQAGIAQVQIQTTLPVVGLVQKTQLWNLVLVNSSGSVLDGRFELVLTDRRTNQEIMTASTAIFTLQKGSVLANINTLNPILYNYIGIEPDKTINNLLPVGSYTACYSFVRNPDDSKREILAEECAPFDVEPLSPPMLSFPSDSSVSEMNPSQFSWTPPLPVTLLSNPYYEVLITEVMQGQKANEAIEENVPFFSGQIRANIMNYSAAQLIFEKDKWYAWQVIARDDKDYAGKSEVWVFKISRKEIPGIPADASPYVQLQRNGAGKAVIKNGMLRFYYFNQLGDNEVTAVVSDISEKSKGNDQQLKMQVSRGDNYIQKDISKLVSLKEGHTYMLSIQNSAMEKWNIMFEIKKEN